MHTQPCTALPVQERAVQHLALPRWQAVAAAPAAIITAATLRYARHAPERTLLYALVQAHYHFAKHGAQEPAHYRPKPRGPPGAAVAA